MMDRSSRNIILAALVGDALGTPVDGLGKGHIRTHFRTIDDYIDPEPALKGKMDRWRKPGLYSSISQFMLICALAGLHRGPCRDEFLRHCAAAIGGSGYGIFRNPDAAERNFIERVNAGTPLTGPALSPTARILPAMAVLGLRNKAPGELMADIIPVIRLFTLDPATMAMSLFLASLLPVLIERSASPAALLPVSAETAGALAGDVEANSAGLFGHGINPGPLARELRGLAGLLAGMAGAGSFEDAERTICAHVNRGLATPVTRATVGLPGALLPFALAICAFHGDGATLLFHAVAQGGSTAPLTALAGAIGACCHESVIPDQLVRNLVNRKKLLMLADSLRANADASRLAGEFIRSEYSLTAKEQEELRARLKHVKKRPKAPPPTRSEKEKALSRHAVESWTKLDKARWRKERKQRDKNDEP